MAIAFKNATIPPIAAAETIDQPVEAAASNVKRGRGRPRSGKAPITIRLDADVVAKFKEGGEGWQAKLNGALREAITPNGGLEQQAIEARRIFKTIQAALPDDCKASHVSPFGLNARIYRVEIPRELEQEARLKAENALAQLKCTGAFFVDWVVVPKKP